LEQIALSCFLGKALKSFAGCVNKRRARFRCLVIFLFSFFFLIVVFLAFVSLIANVVDFSGQFTKNVTENLKYEF